MWIIGRIVYVMPNTILILIEYITRTVSDVDGIDEAVFAKGIDKTPKGFLVAGADVIELINGTMARHFALSFVSTKSE